MLVSKDKTKQEFEKILHIINSDKLDKGYLHDLAGKSDSCVDFNVSNAIWLDKSLPVEAGFRKNVTDKYFSDFRRTEFANTQSAVSEINGWISKKTNHHINEIISTANINSVCIFRYG